MERFDVQFLGSVEVPCHQGNGILCAAMQKVSVRWGPPAPGGTRPLRRVRGPSGGSSHSSQLSLITWCLWAGSVGPPPSCSPSSFSCLKIQTSSH